MSSVYYSGIICRTERIHHANRLTNVVIIIAKSSLLLAVYSIYAFFFFFHRSDSLSKRAYIIVNRGGPRVCVCVCLCLHVCLCVVVFLSGLFVILGGDPGGVNDCSVAASDLNGVLQDLGVVLNPTQAAFLIRVRQWPAVTKPKHYLSLAVTFFFYSRRRLKIGNDIYTYRYHTLQHTSM